jgi:integrase/recombinase XerD
MAVYKRGERWFVKFQIKNVKVWRTIPEARTKAQAQRAEARIKEEVYAGKYGQSIAPLFSQFVEEIYDPWAKANKRSYGTAEAIHLRPLLEFFGKYRLNEVSPFLIERYKQQRKETVTKRKTTRSPASVNRELEVLSHVFSMAVDNDRIPNNPCRKVRKLRTDGGRERYLSEDEEARLMVALEDSPVHLKRFVILALETGLRRGELLGLQYHEVDFVNSELRVYQSKTDRRKIIPLSFAARAVLKAISVEPWFEGSFFTVADVKKSFASACKRAGIEDFRIHDLRHTAATRWRQAGADEFTVMRLLGHTRIDTSAIYAHSTPMEMRAIVERAGCIKEPLPLKKEA